MLGELARGGKGQQERILQRDDGKTHRGWALSSGMQVGGPTWSSSTLLLAVQEVAGDKGTLSLPQPSSSPPSLSP